MKLNLLKSGEFGIEELDGFMFVKKDQFRWYANAHISQYIKKLILVYE